MESNIIKTHIEQKSIIADNRLYIINGSSVQVYGINEPLPSTSVHTYIDHGKTIIQIIVRGGHLYALSTNGTIRDWKIDSMIYMRDPITSKDRQYILDFYIEETSLVAKIENNIIEKFPLSI